MGEVARRKPTVHAMRQRARRDRPPSDGDRSPHQQSERRAGARNRSAPAGGEVMDPMTIGSARCKRARLAWLQRAGQGSRPGTAGSTSRGWSWRTSPANAAFLPRPAGSRWRTFANGYASSKRSPPESTSEHLDCPARLPPGAHSRGGPASLRRAALFRQWQWLWTSDLTLVRELIRNSPRRRERVPFPAAR